ncbi:MAG: type IV pili methyl-accepting chemotaxis transducer N-terminal domain-containing protein [Pseudomonadota bacterium]
MSQQWVLKTAKLVFAALLVTLSGFAAPLPTVLAGEQASDAKRRVNLAGRQRMLTQRMTKAACMITLKVEVPFHTEMLQASHRDFAKALAALELGDPGLRVYGQETNSRVLTGLADVKSHWDGFDQPLREMMGTGQFGGQRADEIFQRNMPLLKRMNEVVSLIEQVHANPNEMLLANAVAINIAGRQRMLSQKIGKEFCQVMLGWNAEETKAALEKTISVFETSHGALASGLPAAGIIPPPTKEIRLALDAFEKRWMTLKSLMQGLIAGTAGPDDLQVFARENDTLLKQMHAIVGMYEKV